MDELGDETAQAGRKAERANRHFVLFSRGLRLLQTRLGFAIIAIALLSATLGPPLLGTLALAIAATVALGGVLLPIAAIVFGITQRFKEMQTVAGSAAHSLWMAGSNFKLAFGEATGKAADIVMRSLAKALEVLTPLLHELTPAFTLVGKALAGVIAQTALAFSVMGPDLERMFMAAIPLIEQFGQMIPGLTFALIRLAIAGMPVLMQLLKWLTAFSFWLGPAIDDADKFAHSTAFLSVLGKVASDTGDVFSYLGHVIADLAVIAYHLYVQNKPLLKLLGTGLVVALVALGNALHFVSQHMNVFGPLLTGILLGLIAWKTYVLADAAATKLWTAAMKAAFVVQRLLIGAMVVFDAVAAANPYVLLALAVIAFIAVLVVLYRKFKLVRDIVSVLWTLLRYSPTGLAIRGYIKLARVLAGPVRAAFRWVINAVRWLLHHIPHIHAPHIGIPNPLHNPFHRQAGGDVHRGGAYTVGETGPELFMPSQSGSIIPNAALAGGHQTIHVPVYLDGRVIAEAVHRQAVRKKATR